MKTRTSIRHIQLSLHSAGVSRGRYLLDIPFDELCREAQAELWEDATHIHLHTDLRLRRYWRRGKWVWRFMNRNGL